MGYSGILCTKCIPGYGRKGDFGCSECPDPAINRLRVFGALAILFILTCILVSTAIKQSKKETQAILMRIIVNSIQLNAMAATINIPWPQVASGIIETQLAVSQVIDQFINIDCFLSGGDNISSFYIKSLLYLIAPPFLLLIPLLIFIPLYLLKKKEVEDFCLINQIDSTHAVNYQYRLYYRYYLTSIMVILFLLHPNITMNNFRMFACKQLGPSNYYLVADFGVQCYTTTFYLWVFGVGVPSFIIYAIGIPILFFHILNTFHAFYSDESVTSLASMPDQIAGFTKQEIRVVTNFLQSGFKPEFFYWEIVNMFHKQLVVAVVIFFSSYSIIQLLLGTLVSVVAFFAQLKNSPYIDPNLNLFQLFSISTSFVVFYGGLYIFSDELNTVIKELIGSFIFIEIILFFIFAIIFLFYIYRSSKRRHLANAERKRVGKAVFEDSEDDDENFEDKGIIINPLIELNNDLNNPANAPSFGDTLLHNSTDFDNSIGIKVASPRDRKNAAQIKSNLEINHRKGQINPKIFSMKHTPRTVVPVPFISDQFAYQHQISSRSIDTGHLRENLPISAANRVPNTKLFSLEQSQIMIVKIIMNGVELELLQNENNRAEFASEFISNLSTTLGFSPTCFKLTNIRAENIESGTTALTLEIISPSSQHPCSLIYEYLDQYTKLPMEYKNIGELSAFIISVAKL